MASLIVLWLHFPIFLSAKEQKLRAREITVSGMLDTQQLQLETSPFLLNCLM